MLEVYLLMWTESESQCRHLKCLMPKLFCIITTGVQLHAQQFAAYVEANTDATGYVSKMAAVTIERTEWRHRHPVCCANWCEENAVNCKILTYSCQPLLPVTLRRTQLLEGVRLRAESKHMPRLLAFDAWAGSATEVIGTQKSWSTRAVKDGITVRDDWKCGSEKCGSSLAVRKVEPILYGKTALNYLLKLSSDLSVVSEWVEFNAPLDTV